MNFHENQFICSRVSPFGRTDGQTPGRQYSLFTVLRKRLEKKGKKKEMWRHKKECWSCLDVLQLLFHSFLFGVFFPTLVTFSYSSNPTGSVTVPENQSRSTQFPVRNAFTSPDILLELHETGILIP